MRYFIIYKPFGMLSQFSKEGEHPTLADLEYNFPKNVYPVGRLDRDSEGLLLLTDDKKLNHRLLNPRFEHQRTYWVQVEKQIDDENIKKLENGVVIRINKKDYTTKQARAKILFNPDVLERNPPIRYRAHIPTSWIALSLIEGKNRQVRRMTAAVGFPTLRLIRYSIENLTIDGFQIGETRELRRDKLMEGLKL